jgi:putative membrane protein
MKQFTLAQHLNWRVLLLRMLVNAAALLATALLLPNIYFVDRSFVILFWMALVLGVLNALVKPVVQFLTLPFIFATYGVVVVLINAGLLWLLSALFPSLFVVDGVLWAFLGGIVMGLLGSFLESLLGVTPPLVPERHRPLGLQGSSQPVALQTLLVQAVSTGATSGVRESTPLAPEAAGAVHVTDAASAEAEPGGPANDSTASEE